MKTCSACGEAKPLEDFPTREGSKVGVYSACRACKTAWARDWQRIQKLKRHGVPDADIPALLLEAASGTCHSCGGPATPARPGSDPRLHVDHDHGTNAYRGLLCKPCNTALGLLGDDVDRIMALAAYLLQSRNLLKDLELLR